MPNYFVFNDDSLPLYTQAVTTSNLAANSILGNAYTINTGVQSIAAGFISVLLTIPSSAGKTIYIDRIFGGSNNAITLSVLRNASFSQSGTALTPRNNNWSFSDNSVCSCKFYSSLTDPTGGGTLMNSLYQSNGDYSMEFQGSMIIPPGFTDRYLCIRVQATLGLSIVVGVTWWEN